MERDVVAGMQIDPAEAADRASSTGRTLIVVEASLSKDVVAWRMFLILSVVDDPSNTRIRVGTTDARHRARR
jgi:hypothetical protein